MKNLPPKISHAETLELCVRAQAGGVAERNAAIAGNMRLAARAAESAARAVNRLDLLDDLIMAGAMGVPGAGWGLLHAVMHFNPAKGTQFATYAYPCVRKAVDMQLASLGRDTGTYKTKEKLSAIRRVAAQLAASLGRGATAAETHAELQRRGGAARVSLARVELALQRPGRETHEEPSSGGEDGVIEALDAKRRSEALRVAVAQLPPEAQAVLTKRYAGKRLSKAEALLAVQAEATLRAALT